jgi:hypothetical protein
MFTLCSFAPTPRIASISDAAVPARKKFLAAMSARAVVTRPWGKLAEDRKMTHSLTGADRTTHLKIVCLALAGALAHVCALAVLIGATAGATHMDTTAARVLMTGPVLKAGKPAVFTALQRTTIQ